MRAIVAVGGRFHADKMAGALRAAGHEVTVHTTLPRWRFPRDIDVKSHLSPEIVYRLSRLVGWGDWGDERKMRAFGRHVASWLERNEPADVLVSWSSFGLEALKRHRSAVQVLVRDSTHIGYQSEQLAEEYRSLGLSFRRREECERRELEEYELAENILVLSGFAKRTFVERGIHPSRVQVIPLGVDTSRFQPRRRAEAKPPLKVVFFGTLGPRKGAHYLGEATASFRPSEIEAYAVGPVETGYRAILGKFRHLKVLPAMRQDKLAAFVRKMDVFVFPTIEDGFGQVVVQAMACGLVPIVSSHCGAAEAIRDGESGFVVPVRDPRAIRERLKRLVAEPEALIELRKEAINGARRYSWNAYDRKIATWLGDCVAKYAPEAAHGAR